MSGDESSDSKRGDSGRGDFSPKSRKKDDGKSQKPSSPESHQMKKSHRDSEEESGKKRWSSPESEEEERSHRSGKDKRHDRSLSYSSDERSRRRSKDRSRRKRRERSLTYSSDERSRRRSRDKYRSRRRDRSSSYSSDDKRSRRRSGDRYKSKRRERSSSTSSEEERPRRRSPDKYKGKRRDRSSSDSYEERKSHHYSEEKYRSKKREPESKRGRKFFRYPMHSKRRGPRPETADTSRRGDPDQPGPSWSGQRVQSAPRFQQPPQQQPSHSQAQQYQARAQQPSKSYGDQDEYAAGDFTSRMSGLNVRQREEEEAWGEAPRRSGKVGAWSQSQPQPQPPLPRSPEAEPELQQQGAWPRPPQSQGRPQYRQQMQESQPRYEQQQPRYEQQQPRYEQQQPRYEQQQPRYEQQQSRYEQQQPRYEQQQSRYEQQQSRYEQQQSRYEQQQPRYEQQQQATSGAVGAWAKGPPQEFQRLAQEKSSKPASEKASLSDQRRPDQPLQQEDFRLRKRQDRKPLSETSDFMDFAPRIFAHQKNGRAIEVFTNFFLLRLENYDITIFHYDVLFEPDVPKSLLRKAWNRIAEEHFPKRVTVFDGMSNVYSKGPLVKGATFRADLNLYLPDSGRTKDYSMMIKEVRRIPMNSLSNYREKIRQSKTIDERKKAVPLAEVSVIEVILKNWPANNLIQHNRVFFPKSDMQPRLCPLSDRLDLRYGYFQSAFLGDKLYLNFDVAHRPFYKSDFMRAFIRDLSQGRIRPDSDEANHFVKGAKVEYSLPDDRKMKMVYRANRLVSNASIQSFEKDGKTMTVAEYFAKEKNYRIRNPTLPLLWVGPTTKTIYLPLELVKFVDDQIYRGALNSGETRKMVMGATTDARKRKQETFQAFTRANFHDNPFLKEFGISISREMETVKARVLDPPKLKTNTVITVKEGAWKARSFLDPKSFNRWCILNLDKSVDRNALVTLQKALQTKAREYSMQIGDPAMSPKDCGGMISYFELQRIFSTMKNMTIVIVVIADTKGLYSRVKTICETQEGILTQCIRGRNITADPRKMMTTLDNLLLKINAKLGGTNHCLNRASSPPCLDGYVMVVGADVTHAGPGSKIPSVAAVAVSCEVSAFQYGITIRVQNGEIITDLKDIMRINLHNFQRIRNRFPEKIFFFRDGVSEGEMEKVLKLEYTAIRDACNQVSCPAKVTLLVVQKRHHTRFFPTCTSDEEGKTYNVPVGTCVDSEIVHPGGLDFYLLSHGSLLGTARPTRYRLLHDDNRLTDDELERLTFYLCHLYSRCNRSVSYPSPTYNAHLAAFRARAYLEGLNLTDRDDLKQVQSKLKDAISASYPMFFV